MRAQFATMEALISLLIVLFAISFVSAEVSLNGKSVLASRSGLVQGMAVYDAFEQITRNASANGCVALASRSGGSPCLDKMVESYKEAFGMRRFGVALPGLSAGDPAANGTLECIPVRFPSLNETDEVCIAAEVG